jgi:hypothetical protein
MIVVTSNITEIVDLNIKRLNNLTQADQLLRTCATTVLALMKVRVHKSGLDSSNNKIGTYSASYMKIRTGNYGNSKKVTRGVNKGNLKDAGVFSKGKSKGQARPKYNRTADTTVIASLTSQMENDEKVIPIELNKSYGIGFSNSVNFDKSQFVQETYKKKIFFMSPDEEKQVVDIVENFTKNALS